MYVNIISRINTAIQYLLENGTDHANNHHSHDGYQQCLVHNFVHNRQLHIDMLEIQRARVIQHISTLEGTALEFMESFVSRPV
jgi:hypothetical protein